MRLETERLILREFNESDLEALACQLADVEVMRFSIGGPITERSLQEEYLKDLLAYYLKHGFGIYAVIHKKDQTLIGGIGLLLQRIDKKEKVELTYRLTPEYWGNGLATEAVQAVCQYAFNELDIKELISIIDKKNSKSIAVSKRLGMHLWKNDIFHGIAVDIYSLKTV